MRELRARSARSVRVVWRYNHPDLDGPAMFALLLLRAALPVA